LVLTSILQTTAVGLTGQAGPPVRQSQEAVSRWVITAPDNRARYRVREQLAGLDFPSDAVGETTAVTGSLVLADDGSVVAEESSFTVDLTTLKTDNDRRDGYVQRRTLETEAYPEATMVVQELRDLPFPIPTSGTHSFTISGELTLHGVSRATVWEVTADFGEETITGQARTAFDFAAFNMAVPSVARVLSVADDIRLELDFRLARDAGSVYPRSGGIVQ
jgi:polyisoprenoid-binding protein YceI